MATVGYKLHGNCDLVPFSQWVVAMVTDVMASVEMGLRPGYQSTPGV
jgi:hypothetical protein